MRKLLVAATVVLTIAVAQSPAAAAAPRQVALGAYLDGAQEVPKTPKSTSDPDASGVALMTLHRDGKLCYVLRTRNVTGKLTVTHLHEGRAGKNGDIVAQLANPMWAGSVASCTDLGRKLARKVWDRPSRFYVNVHTATHPDGAIRGQLHRG